MVGVLLGQPMDPRSRGPASTEGAATLGTLEWMAPKPEVPREIPALLSPLRGLQHTATTWLLPRLAKNLVMERVFPLEMEYPRLYLDCTGR